MTREGRKRHASNIQLGRRQGGEELDQLLGIMSGDRVAYLFEKKEVHYEKADEAKPEA